MSKRVRLRFAPSPTGGLHLGGVRTVLYNYLFARRHDGDFILRIEDTDQSRYVPGAEEYIFDSLAWCGLEPDEGPHKGGPFGPYRQSERKALGIYEKYARQLIDQGNAYYAFDTPDELEQMREKHKTADNPSPQYNYSLRRHMRNSLHLLPEETGALLAAGTPYTIRIKIDPGQIVGLTDMIRGDISFSTDGVDDKVLLKADGMPTYHLAVVVDDYLMQISHAFRGEEWLPSAPVHVLLWSYLFGVEQMPQWAHLPLILKPDGHGKLSKRDGDRLGFPVFAMNWPQSTSPATTPSPAAAPPTTLPTVHSTAPAPAPEPAAGFRETGFLPEAFVNFLALLGWNDGTNQELFSIEELIQRFSMDRVHKGGAKFDYEKAKWFNHEWIKRLPAASYSHLVRPLFEAAGIPTAALTQPATVLAQPTTALPQPTAALPQPTTAPGAPATTPTGPAPQPYFEKILDLVKDRCTLLPEFVRQAGFFFQAPATIDLDAIKSKWTPAKTLFFAEFIRQLELATAWEAPALENNLKEMAAAAGIKPGELLLPLRIMLVGGKFGPHVFDIAVLLGREETIRRIRHVLSAIS